MMAVVVVSEHGAVSVPGISQRCRVIDEKHSGLDTVFLAAFYEAHVSDTLVLIVSSVLCVIWVC